MDKYFIETKKHKILFVMVGVPGSGKSTTAKWLKKEYEEAGTKVCYVSRDEIRFRLIEGISQANYFSKEKEVYNEFITEIKDGLKNADVVIADATHFCTNSRTKLLRSLGASLKDTYVIAYVLGLSLETILAQNDQRVGVTHVPAETIKKMYADFTIPTEEEGFDRILIARKGE